MINLQDFNVKARPLNVKWTQEAEVDLDINLLDHFTDLTFDCFEDIARVNDILQSKSATDGMIYLTEYDMRKSYKPQRIVGYLNSNNFSRQPEWENGK